MGSESTPVARVYNTTTVNFSQEESQQSTGIRIKQTTKSKKVPKKTNKNDLDENFIAPDGGWAWVVCGAAGVANMITFSTMFMFGLLFRERLTKLGISNTEITFLINMSGAISALTGLTNGAMFRRFSYRQVGIAGSLLISVGFFCTSFCESLLGFVIFYAVCFGFGTGITISAASLALNTYFQVKRRKASGLTWALSGAGPMFYPYLVTYLIGSYGVQGAIMIMAAICLNTMLSALIYQPVEYHTPKPKPAEETHLNELDIMCKWCQMQQQPRRNTSIFSSRYLFQNDDPEMPGYEITAPATPMLARANDGWYGSKMSLGPKLRHISTCKDIEDTLSTFSGKKEHQDFLQPNYFKRERDESFSSMTQFKRKHSMNPVPRNFSTLQFSCTCADLKLAKMQISEDGGPIPAPNLTFIQKVVVFFDLGLLKNFTFSSIVIGLTLISFSEMNFTVLTPFILHDFGLTDTQISVTMSLQATMDLITRFMVPFCTEKIPWDNRVFFIVGILIINIGRTILACSSTFYVIVASFVCIGVGKGFRTVFWPLMIPSVVPLKRLPAASGIQLVVTGLFGIFTGPLVGLVRDNYNYSVCLHFLDSLSILVSLVWIIEIIIRHYLKK